MCVFPSFFNMSVNHLLGFLIFIVQLLFYVLMCLPLYQLRSDMFNFTCNSYIQSKLE